MEHFVETKLRGDVVPIGAKAGELSDSAAALLGLPPGIAVASAIIDAHAGVLGSGATEPGQMVLVMGTSLCQMLLSDKNVPMEGICGVVEDGIIPGLYGYETGQPAAGDLFGWYVDHAAPYYIFKEAQEHGV